MDVTELAKLARIKLDAEEAEKLQHDVKRILEYVAEIENAPVVAGDAGVGEVRNVMREDEVSHESGEYTEALLSQAPKRHGNYVEVQQVLENK